MNLHANVVQKWLDVSGSYDFFRGVQMNLFTLTERQMTFAYHNRLLEYVMFEDIQFNENHFTIAWESEPYQKQRYFGASQCSG